jgi:hypothetical protein
MEKHIVQRAALPVYWLDVPITPSLITTGLLRVAAACPQVGGAFVSDWRKSDACTD